MSATPLVSVLMITYNHKSFIRRAIEGVLMQKTNFPFELVIGDDFSTDGTRDICLEYGQKYPEIVRPLLRGKNLGPQPNFTDTFENCRGRYIALCEGDDYWTDENKLQKQVDVLEAEPDVKICFHEALVKNYVKEEKEQFLTRAIVPDPREYFDIDDLFRYEWFMATASVVFRKTADLVLPPFFLEATSGDICLYYLILGRGGKIKMLRDVMSVYRRYGASFSNSHKFQFEHKSKVEMYQSLNKFYDYKFDEGFRAKISAQYKSLADCFYNIGEMQQARKYLVKSLRTHWKANSKNSLILYFKTFARQLAKRN